MQTGETSWNVMVTNKKRKNFKVKEYGIITFLSNTEEGNKKRRRKHLNQ